MDIDKLLKRLESIDPLRVKGRLTQVIGLVIEGRGIPVAVGDICKIVDKSGKFKTFAEVVGFRRDSFLMMSLGPTEGLEPKGFVEPLGRRASFPVGWGLLGRVIDPLGEPLDGRGPIEGEIFYPLYSDPINPLFRRPIREPIDVGVRVINGLLTCGKGQRVGIMAGSGVGKSTLLGMIARHTRADVIVIALIGERGREVQEFIERDLKEGLKKSVVVVATSDRSPLIRMRGAFVATAIAEFFRDRGKDVILLMDSLTRFAMAQREIGLSIGEPPTSKGYTPSVFATMPKLLERAGSIKGKGSITAFYTVLVENDDLEDDPIADSSRAILDGHIVLSRELAAQGCFPAVDVLRSLSRVMPEVVGKEHYELAMKFREVLSVYKQYEDLISIGAYTPGSNPKLDYALKKLDLLFSYIRQDREEGVSLEESYRELEKLFTD
jgi:flagellum-specific ATP synthase